MRTRVPSAAVGSVHQMNEERHEQHLHRICATGRRESHSRGFQRWQGCRARSGPGMAAHASNHCVIKRVNSSIVTRSTHKSLLDCQSVLTTAKKKPVPRRSHSYQIRHRFTNTRISERRLTTRRQQLERHLLAGHGGRRAERCELVTSRWRRPSDAPAGRPLKLPAQNGDVTENLPKRHIFHSR